MMSRRRRRPATVIDKSDSQWHWDRKVPIALIVTLVVLFAGQTWTAAWWASKTDARIEILEKQNAASGPQAATQGDRLTRVETKLEVVQDGIAEIKSILRKEPVLPRRN